MCHTPAPLDYDFLRGTQDPLLILRAVDQSFIRFALGAFMALGTLVAPRTVVAQIRASEHGTVSQQVSSTTITLEYDRPGARGRALFGEGRVVRWGETWTPGANWATTIEVDRDVRIDGHPLPKGKYSLWLVPKVAPTPWTMIFARTAKRFHTRPPAADDEQLRVSVQPEQSVHMETLAWYFPIVTPDGATLRMHWGTTVVPIQIGVEMPQLVSLPEERRTPYVGTYHMRVTPSAGRAPYDVDLVISDVNGGLKLHTVPRDAFGGGELEMVPVADRRFHVAYPEVGRFKGQFYTEPGMIFIFEFAGDHASSVQMLGYDNTVVGRGQFAK